MSISACHGAQFPFTRLLSCLFPKPGTSGAVTPQVPSVLVMVTTAMQQLEVVIHVPTAFSCWPNVVLFNGTVQVKDTSTDGASPLLSLEQGRTNLVGLQFSFISISSRF